MYPRILKKPLEIGRSFFLFGPRGTGKTTWLRTHASDAIYFDLLDSGVYTDLLARPERLEEMIVSPGERWIVIDEVQRVPMLLNEVHRLIESRGFNFVLTGSSARTLRRGGVNLLAGRALTFHMYPLTAEELGKDFDLESSLSHGHLPSAYSGSSASEYLQSYVATYLREEVLQEGLTRNIGAFSRFVDYSAVARETGIERKTVVNYFTILEDLLLAFTLPVFSKRAKRRLMGHVKFYFFDAGIYRTIRPSGPLDAPEEIRGIALETLCHQELRAVNEYHRLGYALYYWRTATGAEVDFVLYGPLGLIGIEVKHARRVSKADLSGLRIFGKDYPEARRLLIYMGEREELREGIHIIPASQAIPSFKKLLSEGSG
jgi:predicted AAA+ superfamily ATPase